MVLTRRSLPRFLYFLVSLSLSSPPTPLTNPLLPPSSLAATTLNTEGLRRPICDLCLLMFHLVISSFTFQGVDIPLASKILEYNLERYPDSVFFLFGAGRLGLIRVSSVYLFLLGYWRSFSRPFEHRAICALEPSPLTRSFVFRLIPHAVLGPDPSSYPHPPLLLACSLSLPSMIFPHTITY